MKANLFPSHDLPDLKGKRLLIFDFDGTVADTSPLHEIAFARVLAPLGVSVDYSLIAGLNTLDAIRFCLASRCLDLPADEVARLAAAKQACVRLMISEGVTPVPGVDAFLRRAKEHYRLALVTSGSIATVGLALGKLGYEGWFDPLVCADDVTHAKPDPEGFLTALQVTGIPAEEAIVFEDSLAGFVAASAAGLEYVDVVAASWIRLAEILP